MKFIAIDSYLQIECKVLRSCLSAPVGEQKQTKPNESKVLQEYSNISLFFDVFLENRECPSKQIFASPNRILVGQIKILTHPDRPQNR